MLKQLALALRTGLLVSVLFLQYVQAAVPEQTASLSEGIMAYREGRYLEAETYFQQMHAQHPEDSKATYYLAITQAQLGRFQKAKTLYEEVLVLDPASESAKLAQEGLLYLPAETNLDSPPKFQKSIVAEQDKSFPENHANTLAPAENTGMSQQDMMAWQMMMSQMGGNQQQQGGGMNPLMYMMPQMTGPNAPKIDPGVMSNMLMNQMMQNFSLDGNKQDNQ